MSKLLQPGNDEIDKQSISAIVTFAQKNIPGMDEFTLNKFRELIGVTGSFGSLTSGQLTYMIGLMKKYIPRTCDHSLRVIVDLLEIFSPLSKDRIEN